MVSGQWKYPNGTYFEGSFGFNKPKGKGLWKFENGNKLSLGDFQKYLRTKYGHLNVNVNRDLVP